MKRRVSLEFEDGVPYLVTRTPIRVSLKEISINQLADLYLTKREREVLQGICEFKMNKEIAGELNLSERTIKFHVSNLLAKYRCAGRQELASKFVPDAGQGKVQ